MRTTKSKLLLSEYQLLAGDAGRCDVPDCHERAVVKLVTYYVGEHLHQGPFLCDDHQDELADELETPAPDEERS